MKTVFTKAVEAPEAWQQGNVFDGHFINAFLSILRLAHDSPAMVGRAHDDKGSRFIILQSLSGTYMLDPVRCELIADALEAATEQMCPRCHAFHLEVAAAMRSEAKAFREGLH